MTSPIIPEESFVVVDNHKAHGNAVSAVCFSPDQTRLCSGCWGSKLIQWDLCTSQKISEEKIPNELIWDVAYSPDGKLVATGSGSSIRLWISKGKDENFSEILKNLPNGRSSVYCVRFTSCGNTLIYGGTSRTITILDVETKKHIFELDGEGTQWDLDLLQDDNTLISSQGWTNNVKLWDLRKKSRIHTFDHHTSTVFCGKFQPSSTYFASGSDDNTCGICDIRTMKVVHTHKEHSRTVRGLGFHPSGDYLITGSVDKTIKIFDTLERTLLYSLDHHHDAVRTVQFSPDGKYFASGSRSSEVFIWRSRLKAKTSYAKEDEEERKVYLVEYIFKESTSNPYYFELKILTNTICVSKVLFLI